ncbi:phosphoribosylformylglycinamidine cyclo-ligase [Peptostreptococcaceae bacterium AGR-M142]
MDKLTYKDSGVNIEEGNKFVSDIKDMVSSTFSNNVLGKIGLFSGGYSLKDFKYMDEPILLSATDGVGTKLMISKDACIHDTVGIDLVAMSVNDLICQGAKPLFFLDYIGVGKLDSKVSIDIVKGITDGCKMAQCSLIGGETAEMPGMYDDNEYDLAGFAVGICDKKNIITGQDIKVGDCIIGLKSSGIHSNGYSLVRKLFFEKLNMNLDSKLENFDESLKEVLLRPTKIYVKTVMGILKDFDIKGIAHITGGGLLENVPRILKEGLSANINEEKLFKVDIFEFIKSTNLIDKTELYRSFNMGVGMTIICDSKDSDKITQKINEIGEDEAKVIGTIVEGDGVVIC